MSCRGLRAVRRARKLEDHNLGTADGCALHSAEGAPPPFVIGFNDAEVQPCAQLRQEVNEGPAEAISFASRDDYMAVCPQQAPRRVQRLRKPAQHTRVVRAPMRPENSSSGEIDENQ